MSPQISDEDDSYSVLARTRISPHGFGAPIIRLVNHLFAAALDLMPATSISNQPKLSEVRCRVDGIMTRIERLRSRSSPRGLAPEADGALDIGEKRLPQMAASTIASGTRSRHGVCRRCGVLRRVIVLRILDRRHWRSNSPNSMPGKRAANYARVSRSRTPDMITADRQRQDHDAVTRRSEKITTRRQKIVTVEIRWSITERITQIQSIEHRSQFRLGCARSCARTRTS